MDALWTPQARHKEYSYWQKRLEQTKDVLDRCLAEMSSVMVIAFEARPVDRGWTSKQGSAQTPVGVGPSINYHRNFTDGYEVVFYTRSGLFIVFHHGISVATYSIVGKV